MTIEARCCGQCHPAVGGCLYGIVWPYKRTALGIVEWIEDVRAGRTLTDADGCEAGTPPCVRVDGKWVRE